jgi:type I restriction enzyme S subunit
VSPWPLVGLGEVAEFINGKAFKPSDWSEQGQRIVRIQNLTDPAKIYNRTERPVPERFCVLPGELLVSWSATLGVFEWEGPDTALVNQHIFRVVPKETVTDKRYLKHIMVGALANMEWHLHGATMKHVNRAEFLQSRIPLPPLDEQRRIARVLDATDGLRAKRRKCLRHLHALVGAIYTDLFQGEWRQYQLGDVLDRIDSGSSPVCETRPANGAEWGVLKLGAISFGRYDPRENKALLPGCAPRPADEVRAGDILLARKNTRELVGASVLVHDTPDRLMLPDLIFRLVPAEDAPLDAAYLQATLAQPRNRAAIARLAGGSAGSMPNISKARLRSIKVDVPPIERQQRYSERTRQVELIRQRVQAHLAHLDDLFTSLQSRAFAGDL